MNIKVWPQQILKAVVLVLLMLFMKFAVERRSGGTIYIPVSMTISSGA
jgi:hypothetical protein